MIIDFRDYPTFLACVLCSLMAIMKSYPALGDATVPFALLALWAHVFPCEFLFTLSNFPLEPEFIFCLV